MHPPQITAGEPSTSQPSSGKGTTAVQIRLPPPAPLPLAYHATLLQGPGPLQVAAGVGVDASGILPFPQPRRPGHALDPRDGFSNSGLPPMVSMALPSAASASLPRIGSGAPTAGGNASPPVARAAATPPADGGSGQRTETETPGGSLHDPGDDSHPRGGGGGGGGGSQGRCRSRSTQPAANGGLRKSKYRCAGRYAGQDVGRCGGQCTGHFFPPRWRSQSYGRYVEPRPWCSLTGGLRHLRTSCQHCGPLGLGFPSKAQSPCISYGAPGCWIPPN
jgi:hypothetical protein